MICFACAEDHDPITMRRSLWYLGEKVCKDCHWVEVDDTELYEGLK